MTTRAGAVSAKRGLSGLIAAGALAAICAFSAPGAASAAGFFQNYQVNTDFDIYSIALYQGTSPTGVSGGLTNSFNIGPPGGVITDPFLKLNDITATYFLGVSNLGGEVTFENDSETLPQKHLILALNNNFALGAIGQDFSALFTNYTETSLIDALVLLGTANLPDGDPGLQAQLDAKDAAYNLLFSFSDVVVSQGGAFGSVDNYSMVSFSTGASFGAQGNSFITPGPIPEPTTWALMILGFGSAGAMLRRRRQQQSVAGA
jgi:hypothetical protein